MPQPFSFPYAQDWGVHWIRRRVLGENEGMRVEVECYSGRKADERPVRFRLDGHEYMVERCRTSGTAPNTCFSRSGRTTAMSTSCGTRPQCLTVTGILFPSGGPAESMRTELIHD